MYRPSVARYRPDADLGARSPQRAVLAPRVARVADLPAVVDQPLAERRPVLLRQQRVKVALDADGVGVERQSDALAEAGDVRIDGDAGHVEAVAQHDVRRLATDAG